MVAFICPTWKSDNEVEFWHQQDLQKIKSPDALVVICGSSMCLRAFYSVFLNFFCCVRIQKDVAGDDDNALYISIASLLGLWNLLVASFILVFIELCIISVWVSGLELAFEQLRYLHFILNF